MLSPPLASLPPPRRRNWRRWQRWGAVTLACWMLAVSLGVLGASLVGRQLPEVRSLEDYVPPGLSRIYTAEGTLLRQFGEQRRIVIQLSDLPLTFREALVAVEDADFHRHPGVDITAIMRAVWTDIRSGRRAQGGSTITQQLARDLFLTKDKTIRRKIQEWLLAVQIETSYTKDEILLLYCNQIYFGHGFYGVEAASRFYLGKPASALSLDEAALLAGLVQRPESYSPYRNPERARQRRNLVLRRMASEGYLTLEQSQTAAARPVQTHVTGGDGQHLGQYFLEEVRKDVVRRLGEKALYREGLEIQTTMDAKLQAHAEHVLQRHLRAIDRSRGFRAVTENVAEHGSSIESWEDPSWNGTPGAGDTVRGVVVSVQRGAAEIRIADHQGRLESSGAGWTGESDLRRLLSPGALTLFTVAAEKEDGSLVLELEQEPEVEGAVVVLDPASGRVLALVGGYDFQRSQFNRAVQARRQVGSAFKPILFAAALEEGYPPSELILDAPTVFVDERGGNAYQPENYERDYWGLITLRSALEHSRNIPAVKLLGNIGFKPVQDLARRLGITATLHPYPSLALGAVEISLLEMTAAYAAFANGGLFMQPYMLEKLEDRDGRPLYVASPRATEAIEPAVVHVVTQMLQGVVRRGTAASIADFPRPVAGKTGTTDGHSDAWFIGYTPDLVCGVWIGLDRSESIGHGQSGARVALPLWDEIMRAATEERPVVDFHRPPGVLQVPVDPDTGLRASVDTGCPRIHLESFVEGTKPSGPCGSVAHFRHSLPAFLQLQPLGNDLRFHLTSAELDHLLSREPRALSWLPLSSSISVVEGDRALSIGVEVTDRQGDGFPSPWRSPSPAPAVRPAGRLLQLELQAAAPPEVAETVAAPGLDGRPAAVLTLRSDR